MKIETLKISDLNGGYIVINKDDYIPTEHYLYDSLPEQPIKMTPGISTVIDPIPTELTELTIYALRKLCEGYNIDYSKKDGKKTLIKLIEAKESDG